MATLDPKTQPMFMSPKGPVSEIPPNTVCLVQPPRAAYAPSMSPFPLKLETYLRLADIPYVTDVSSFSSRSSKNKIPWIKYNGESMGDSKIIMEFLNKSFKKDLNKKIMLSTVERAATEAIRIMIDEHLYWILMYFRWVDDEEFLTLSQGFPFPKEVFPGIAKGVTEQLQGQGVGRHSAEEVHHFLKEDLKIIRDYLDTKKFLSGDTPCEADCSAFGMLAQVHWQNITPRVKDVLKEFPTLVAYTERMRDLVWPDWDECITHGYTRQATQ